MTNIPWLSQMALIEIDGFDTELNSMVIFHGYVK